MLLLEPKLYLHKSNIAMPAKYLLVSTCIYWGMEALKQPSALPYKGDY